MAVATRGGDVAGVIFHTDNRTQYSAGAFAAACAGLGIRQSMGRASCALDNAAAESFFSTPQHERLSRSNYATRAQARRDVAAWIDHRHNRRRRHSSTDMLSPIDYELAVLGIEVGSSAMG